MSELDDLRMRCLRAEDDLHDLYVKAHGTEHWRLQGKLEGVRLVMSYIEEMVR